MRKAFKILKLNANVFFFFLCLDARAHLKIDYESAPSLSRTEREFYFVYVLSSPVIVSSISPSPPSCIAIIHTSVSVFYFTHSLCACSCATAAAVYSGLIKHNRESRSDKHRPQPIVSTLDGVHKFKCNKKARHCDFKCLGQVVITGTDTPLMHFCNAVLFPG